MKRNSKLVMLTISITLITLISVYPSQTLACGRRQYWPDWDKWRSTSPERQMMNSTVIENMYTFIDYNDINIQSMLIIRNGYIINEEYLYDSKRMEQKSYYWPDADPFIDLRDGRLHSCWSVTKSIISLLTGIAIEKGYFDLDTKFFDVFPDKWSDDYIDSVYGDAKKDITVKNMLVQNSGIEWDELVSVVDWWPYDFSLDYYLKQPMAYLPGENYGGTFDMFTYSSGNQEMLSVMIANKSGMTMADFARKYLFKPLKIRDSEWDWWWGASAYGNDDLSIKYHGGFGLFMTHRALARIGLMCLNEGKWRGRQVVPEDWISESSSVQIDPFGSLSDLNYGYLWWITPTEYYPVEYYQAIGLYGQEIVVIPEYDIVVVITSNEAVKTYFYGTPNNYIIEEFILKAVLATTPWHWQKGWN